MSLEIYVSAMPVVVGILYSSVSVAYLMKGDVPWAIIWGGYAIANVGLVVVGLRP